MSEEYLEAASLKRERDHQAVLLEKLSVKYKRKDHAKTDIMNLIK